MEEAAIRRSNTTLLDQLSAIEPAALPNVHAEAAGGAGGRTLLEIIREETAPPSERAPGRPMRVSLMTLMSLAEKAGGVAEGAERAEEEESADERRVCCVCMKRRKGAAFIPCGHTFCRSCSRELFAGRGRCPVCNRDISDILDIF